MKSEYIGLAKIRIIYIQIGRQKSFLDKGDFNGPSQIFCATDKFSKTTVSTKYDM